ncbi:MAG: DNA polymerase III subunit beta [Bacteroidales bacterium]|nr:DNA polymerase III subunit beta [Bacteroidales bacterium]MDD4712928.1 DNA polymerase III subunit beta [Bacteroidales bacterium]
MKFIASSSALLSHLQAISRVINSKNTLPILECFLLKIEGLKLTATASDTETTLVTNFDLIEADRDGSFAIPSKTLLDSLRELSEQPLTIEIDENSLEVTIYYQNGKYKFVAQNGDEFPKMKELKENCSNLEIPANILLNGINSTVFASADDELRPVMNGVVLDITPEDVTFVASDSHKLVRLKNTSIHGEQKSTLIVPKKPANLLRVILPKETGNVIISFDDSNVVFRLSNYTIFCRLVEGRFPNYNVVIPQNNPYKVLVDRVSLLNTLKRVAIFANQSSSLVKMVITDNKIELTTQDIDFSTSAEETISCQYEGDRIIIGFKAQFIIDIVSNLNTQDIVLELADPSRAGLFLPLQNEENEDLLMLLMPMLLND